MQTEVPTLPVVNLNKNVNRKQNPDLRSTPVEVKPPSSCRNTACLSSNKKRLHPLLGGPYRSNVRPQPLSEHSKTNKSSIGQRVLSAKMLRLKELQNQLADAHYHLNELANENRLLKALQKRQDSALKRYEGADAELPRIINSHHEELRVLQIKYKKLKALHKETCDLLKEKESELQCLQSQNKHLLQLSKDRNLGEREKLQLQVSDLNHRIQQQQETIQTLHRRLTLESKSLKHQLNTEISKRKEAQKNLEDTTEKLKTLESLLDNRERRLYYSGHLPDHNKGRLGTQSLTNLRDVSASNSLKLSDGDKRWQKDIQKDNLPLLNAPESNDDENSNKGNENTNPNQTSDFLSTETMASLQQIRKYRLQKPSHMHRSSFSVDDLEPTQTDTQLKLNGNPSAYMHARKLRNLNRSPNDETLVQHEMKADEFRRIFENRKYKNSNESSDEVKVKFEYSTDDTDDMESENESRNFKNDYAMDVAKNSRELHTRLTSYVDQVSERKNSLRQSNIENNETTLENLLAKKLTFSNCKHKGKPQQQEGSYENNSALESELKQQLNGAHSFGEHENKFKPLLLKYDQQHSFKSNEHYEELVHLNSHQINDVPRIYFNESRRVCQNLLEGSEAESASEQIIDGKYLDDNATKSDTHNLRYGLEHNGEQYTNTFYLADNARDQQQFNQTVPEEEKSTNLSAAEDSLKDEQITEVVRTQHFTNNYEDHKVFYETLNTDKTSAEVEEEAVLYNSEDQSTNAEVESWRINPLDTLPKSNEETLTNISQDNEKKPISPNACLLDVKVKNEVNDEDILVEQETKRLSNNVQSVQHQSEQKHDNMHEDINKAKVINYNKEKLLATMKAIDNNENIEFLNQDYRKHNSASRKQITENLFRGLPTQTRRKQEIIRDIFESDNIENKPRSSCSKLH